MQAEAGCLRDKGWGADERHLHDLRVGQRFRLTFTGHEGKLVRRGIGSCGVRWAKVRRHYNVATGRTKKKRGWGPVVEIAPCTVVQT